VLDAQGVKDDIEVSLLFVDEPTIAELRQRFLGQEGPTDVLAFPIDEEPEPAAARPTRAGPDPAPAPPTRTPCPSCSVTWWCVPAVAARNAGEHGVTIDDEMALLVVHGLLHLLGMDHEIDEEAERMERASASCWPASTGRWGSWPVAVVAAASRFRSTDWILIAVVLRAVRRLGRSGPGRDEPGADEPDQGHGPGGRRRRGAGSLVRLVEDPEGS
jgi:probable rRNA maturation factor